jgi:7-keto-8-aminopelargonate synthetase-like enzyme
LRPYFQQFFECHWSDGGTFLPLRLRREKTMQQPNLHRFRNNQKAVEIGNLSWESARQQGALDIRCHYAGNDRMETPEGHRFINLCSCAYLGLQTHPWVIEGAIEALQNEPMFILPMSRIRVRPSLLDEAQDGLSELWRSRCLITVSCFAATASVLPLVASGHLMDDGQPRVMVFDRFSHFSMNFIKPICADETTVLTSPHNDLDYLEDACKKYPRVAYVADGAYSMGGATLIEGLRDLQDRYGLFLYLDDSHSISAWGRHGEGFARAHLGEELNPLTVISASLGKGFGASGGVIMMGNPKHEQVLIRFGGPIAWSTGANTPTLGAILGALRVHNSAELPLRQRRMRANTEIFDSYFPTEEAGNGLPIRLIPVASEQLAAEASGELMRRGFYSSAVFFPILARGKAGLRVMLRADNRPEDVRAFCTAVEDILQPAEAEAALACA